MKISPKYRFFVVLAPVLMMMGLVLGTGALSQDSAPAQSGGAQLPGQSATLLPDGTILLAGGLAADGPTDIVALLAGGTVIPLAGGLVAARVWHTATVLSDGKVAIIGGVGTGGEAIATVEEFDPRQRTFQSVEVAGLTARSHHTATLLSDGSVLIAGGVSGTGKTLGDAQIWNPRTGKTTSVPAGLNTPRSGHTAALQPDGTVLITGGVDSQGSRLDAAESYDPKSGVFSPISPGEALSSSDSEEAAVRVAGTIPADGATGVSTATVISLRFSTPMDVTSIDASTITLIGPRAAVRVEVAAAEEGMLAFVNPDSPLAPNATYTVTADGVVARDGSRMVRTSFSFTTGAAAGGAGGGINSSFSPGSSESSDPAATAKVWTPTSDWLTHLPPSQWQSLPPLRAPAGVTALSGQVLTIEGLPLAGVTLRVGQQKAMSDQSGRFLLKNLTLGKAGLFIDGATADRGRNTFGLFEVAVAIAPRVTTVLPYTIWMPVLDTAHAVTIPSPTTTDTVVSNPLMPGLILHIPAGTTITDVNGKIVRTLTITPVPLDRPPFPLPTGVQVPIYFTIQPGLAQLWSGPGKWAWAQLYYPNPRDLAPGTRFDFWNYDAGQAGWYVYGQGSVAKDGHEVVPDAGVGIWSFSGAMVGSSGEPPTTGAPDCDDGCDPVDSSTGLLRHNETDLHLTDVIPIQLTRSYLSQDQASRPFGIGTTDNYEIYMTANGAWLYSTLDLVLPDGEKVHYTNTSSNPSSWIQANFVPTLTSNPAYYGSAITWNGNGWNLRLRNGTIYSFPDSFNINNPAKAALIGVTDRYGNQLTISRDSNGNVTQITSPNSRWVQFTHDSNNRVTQATDNIGRTVTYTYNSYSAAGRPTCNSSGMLCAVTDANGGVTSYTYDGADRILTITDPRGNTQLTNTYDPASGRVSMQTLADGTSTYQFGYTLGGNGHVSQTNVTDPNGNVEQKVFDTNGFVSGVTYALGVSGVQQSFTYARDPSTELITSLTDPLGRQTTYGYDGNANLTSVTRLAGTPNAVTTTFSYDPTYNQLTSVLDPLNHTWTLGRDSQGNLTTVTDPLNHSITMTYNGSGQPLTIADAAGNTTSFSYTFGDLSAITDPLASVTGLFTDAAGRTQSVTDPLGHVTLFAYDSGDRQTSVTGPSGNVTALRYDGNGNLLSLTDANHNATSYGYDSRNRLTSRTDGLQVAESYGYDRNGNLTAHTDRNGNVTAYQYDALNRRRFAGFGFNGTGYQSTINYTLDGGNRMTQAVDSLAGTVSRGYDGLNRLTSETTPQGNITYAYDNAGRRTSMTVAGQAAVNYSWDNANRLTSITQGSASVSFAYDNANRRMTLTLPNGVTVAYSYDNDSHVAGLTYSMGSTQLGNLTYGYDADGRVTSKGGSLALTAMPANASGNVFNADNEMTTFGLQTLAYDANGNLTGDGTNTYTWDARNHLSAISGGVAASFVYDGLGRRMSKTIAGTTGQFLYDRLNPMQELDGASPPNITANVLTGLGIDEYFSRTDSSGAMSFLRDDPSDFIDSFGLFRYSPTAGGPLDDPTTLATACFEECIGQPVTVTGAREPSPPHVSGSAHNTGQACDIGKNSNPNLPPLPDIEFCFNNCFNYFGDA